MSKNRQDMARITISIHADQVARIVAKHFGYSDIEIDLPTNCVSINPISLDEDENEFVYVNFDFVAQLGFDSKTGVRNDG